MVSNDIKFFESGFLVISSGSTNGPVLLGLQDISIDYSVETTEMLAFESNFSKIISPTFKSWTFSASGVFLTLSGTSGESTHPQSGETRVVGSHGGATLLELIKTRSTTTKAIFKLSPSNYQSGTVILTKYSISSSAGEPLTFSIEGTGSGDLVKSLT